MDEIQKAKEILETAKIAYEQSGRIDPIRIFVQWETIIELLEKATK